MSANVFEIKDALTAGWEGFVKNVVVLAALPIALAVISGVIYGFAMLFMMILPLLIILFPILILIEAVLSAYTLFCMVKASLAILKGETVSWEILKTDPASFVRFFAVFLIIGVTAAIVSTVISFTFAAVLGAKLASMALIALLLFSLGAAVAAFFFPAQYIIIDKQEVSIIDSLKNSWNLTFPRAVQCLIFILACLAINCIASVPFGLGLIISIPVTIIAAAFVYKKLEAAPVETTAVTDTPASTDSLPK